MRRRAFLATPLLVASEAARASGAAGTASATPATASARTAGTARRVDYPAVVPGPALVFPRDFGSHPDYRIEWWYVTGWVRDATGAEFGVQVTFFRHRPGLAEDNPSAFAPRQILFAHAALADPGTGRLRHDQRAARAGFGLAEAAEGTTDVRIGDWSLLRADGRYRARIAAREFALDLAFTPTAPVLLQGELGWSRKGPAPRQASWYYSEPQLTVAGRVVAGGGARAVAGIAWLDHEWSSEIMAGDAVGWDWIGINLADGGALMAFRMRDAAGNALWAAATLRTAAGERRSFGPDAVRFLPQRHWRSPRTGTTWPVALAVAVGDAEYALLPLFDDQELDSRATTGTIYWEGAVRAYAGGAEVGRGYLELTGYGEALRL